MEELGSELQIKTPTVLVEAGSPCDSLFVVVDGILSVNLPQGLSFSQPIDRLEAGGIFGELCWIEKCSSPFQLKVLGPSTVLKLSFKALDDFFDAAPDLERRVLRRLVRHLAQQVRRQHFVKGNPNA